MASSTFKLLVFLCVISISCLVSTKAKHGGFSVELIHRDSPKSPFYSPSETPSQRLTKALRRSTARVNHFSPTKPASLSTSESEIINYEGEYLMSISVGTPPTKILAIADTGSDLIWTQCNPCSECYEQVDPLFDPKTSATYRNLSCISDQCQSLQTTTCSSSSMFPICRYTYSYGDNSFTRGNLALDTITLESTNGTPIAFPNCLFGCGRSNSGSFSERGSGVIGLGAGSISLITQMGSSVDGKFSYCLVPFASNTSNSGTLNFGANAIVSGHGVKSTPLVTRNPDTFYLLTLESISIGNHTIEFTGSTLGTKEGNMIIDSGTTVTHVPTEFFNKLVTVVDSIVTNKRADDPNGVLKLCYSSISNIKLPKFTAHFKGADWTLNPSTLFVQMTDDVVCFAFNPTDHGAIFGNLAQSNYLVGYDLQAKTLSFKPTDCSNK